MEVELLFKKAPTGRFPWKKITLMPPSHLSAVMSADPQPKFLVFIWNNNHTYPVAVVWSKYENFSNQASLLSQTGSFPNYWHLKSMNCVTKRLCTPWTHSHDLLYNVSHISNLKNQNWLARKHTHS